MLQNIYTLYFSSQINAFTNSRLLFSLLIMLLQYDGSEGSCYSNNFFCYANKIFVTCFFFSVPISKFFISFIIMICNAVFFLLLKLFCFNFSFLVFHLIYLCYSIFFVLNVVYIFV